jgi:hypothetical protein
MTSSSANPYRAAERCADPADALTGHIRAARELVLLDAFGGPFWVCHLLPCNRAAVRSRRMNLTEDKENVVCRWVAYLGSPTAPRSCCMIAALTDRAEPPSRAKYGPSQRRWDRAGLV